MDATLLTNTTAFLEIAKYRHHGSDLLEALERFEKSQ
jgi:hypothetical protein